jgi:hypothetical protein
MAVQSLFSISFSAVTQQAANQDVGRPVRILHRRNSLPDLAQPKLTFHRRPSLPATMLDIPTLPLTLMFSTTRFKNKVASNALSAKIRRIQSRRNRTPKYLTSIIESGSEREPNVPTSIVLEATFLEKASMLS